VEVVTALVLLMWGIGRYCDHSQMSWVVGFSILVAALTVHAGLSKTMTDDEREDLMRFYGPL
jgi:hypothetical protein